MTPRGRVVERTTPRRLRHVAQLALLLVALSACDTPFARERMTSDQLRAAGERDTVLLRRLRSAEQRADSIDTDTLVILLVRLSRTRGTEAVNAVQSQLMCWTTNQMKRYGTIAVTIADDRVNDSLFRVPGFRKEVREAMADHTMASLSDCKMADAPVAPESLSWNPLSRWSSDSARKDRSASYP